MDLIKIARRDHVEAAKRIIECTKDVYSVGQIVTVELGRATIKAEITSFNESWWHEPGRMTGRNTKTGAYRNFYHRDVIGDE